MVTPGRTARKPTLETVAARAGVSKSLVSLVLRNSPKVSAASREAVMRAVAELGYRPNAAARLLAERQSHTIGVLLNDLRQPWFADMLDGLTPALHAGGKHILLGDGRIDRMLDETLTWSFIDLGVDGLVLAGSIPMSQAIIDAASQIPTVAVGGRGLDVDLPHVDILANDNHLGGTLAVRHLIELGHTRIAHIHGLPSVAGRLRMQGYEDTMRAAGLGGSVHIEAGDMSEEGGYRATVRLLSGPGPADRHLRGQRPDLRRRAVRRRGPRRQGPGRALPGRLRQLRLRPPAGAVAHQRRRHRVRAGTASRPDAPGPHRAPRRPRRDRAAAAAPGSPGLKRPRPGLGRFFAVVPWNGVDPRT